MDEAQRCLHCKHRPCVAGCPVNVHIPDFIAKVAAGDSRAPMRSSPRPTPCPPCAAGCALRRPSVRPKCVRGIKGEPVAIGRLERFVADWHNKNVSAAPHKPAPNGHKVAVVGSGPAGLTCAGRSGQEGLRRHRVRGVPHRWRRAGVRHPGVPAAQGHCAEARWTKLNALGVDVRDQHGHRPGALH